MMTDQCGLCGKDIHVIASRHTVWTCYGEFNDDKCCYSTWEYPIPPEIFGLKRPQSRLADYEESLLR